MIPLNSIFSGFGKDTFSWKGVISHFLLILFIISLIIFFLFNIYLPKATNHGDTITVPDLVGMDYNKLREFFTQRNLRFEVVPDSGYSKEKPPLSVLKQYPLANSKVKEKRGIYLTLNATTPPIVKMPNLKDVSLKNAELALKSVGLLVGSITYKSDFTINLVLEQQIEPGVSVHKGDSIDLVLSNGYGQLIEMPMLTGMERDEAEFLINGNGFLLNPVSEMIAEGVAPNTVIKQNPLAGQLLVIGSKVDIWVTPGIYASDSTFKGLITE